MAPAWFSAGSGPPVHTVISFSLLSNLVDEALARFYCEEASSQRKHPCRAG